jgi:hypothetical protein
MRGPTCIVWADLTPLSLKYAVDTVFVGHNHNYERTHAVANLTVVSRGRPVFSAGSAGGAGGGHGR